MTDLRADLCDLEETGIAIEHVLWAASRRMSARDLIASIGIRWPTDREPSWHDAAQALVWKRHRLSSPVNNVIALRRRVA